MLRAALFALSLLLTSGTHTLASTNCNDAEDQATMNKCANDDFNHSDKLLNANYRKIEHRLADDQDAMKLLVQSQRAWVKFRDAECNFSAHGTVGGSMHPMMVSMCRAELTKDRNKQLADYLKCEEGDLSCPVPFGD
ncbi:lysozyme inhibitor LprI family protein [Brucella anthropi]|uniref:lysozyme inhibitor LprI family protein n=1 Tax=Brucella anthropi TaxID=529 RepID=UPI003D984307